MSTQSNLHDNLHDFDLYALIGRMIDDGRLPVLLPGDITSGYGSGSKCDACDHPITHTQIEYEVGDSTAQLNLHLECYVLWQIECVRRLKERNGSLLN